MGKADRTLKVSLESVRAETANGAAWAAFLAAGVGAFAMGLFVILNEAGVFTAPSLYAPAGGVSGRTTFATLAWLITWVVLHHRWKDLRIEPRRVFRITVALIGLGILATFPPVWGIF
jgi:hypothetical protein